MEPPQSLFLQYKLHLVQKWGISIAWPLETSVGERSFEERWGTLDRDDNEPWEGGGEEEGWLHVSFPYLSLNRVWSSYKGVICCSASE